MPHIKAIQIDHQYRLLRPIALGGMGSVYEGELLGAGGFVKKVAIKIIREEFSTVPEFRSNFVGEAKLVADLIHANIVQIYYLGEIHGQYFMVMEYVDGITLHDFILQHKALKKAIPHKIACFIISRICRGLAYAHEKRNKDKQLLGIVHRDVNPRNIMLSFGGDVKLADFGIAKATKLMYNREGKMIAGKDEYLSPEQARMEITDSRADLFSCGVILSEMICGKNIFLGENGQQTRENIQTQPLPDFNKFNPKTNSALIEILEQVLERDLSQRTKSARLLFTALEYYLYKDSYGPTHEKLATYMNKLFADGIAFKITQDPFPSGSYGINAPTPI